MKTAIAVLFLCVLSSTSYAQLQITYPAGGEDFPADADSSIVVTWTGVLPTDTVLLEFSATGGFKWETIDKATGLQYVWKLPSAVSNSCYIRATANQQSVTTNSSFAISGFVNSDLHVTSKEFASVTKVYPNPASSHITVEIECNGRSKRTIMINGFCGIVHQEVIDVPGYKTIVSKKIELPKWLSSGVYAVSVADANGGSAIGFVVIK